MSASTPAVVDEDIARVVEANGAFALDLYRHLAREGSNVLFSPASTSSALVMAFAGAANRTAEQMAAVLHLDLPPARAIRAWLALQGSITEETQLGTALDVANSVWAQEGMPFHNRFLELMRHAAGEEVRWVDFVRSARRARRLINAWVSERTHDRIPALLDREMIDSQTALVLVNAVYLHAGWASGFNPSATRDVPFLVHPDRVVSVRMMNQVASFPYGRRDGCDVVELPYQGALSLVVLAPGRGRLQDFERGLDARALEDLLSSLAPTEIDLELPKLSLGAKGDLAGALAALGMPDAFSSTADFSAMTPAPVWIRAVAHESMVDIDEEGTTAAAATAAVMYLSAKPRPSIRVNDPYMFLVRHRPTGTILFLGRVLDPTWTSATISSQACSE